MSRNCVEDIKGKKILIVGMGNSGKAAMQAMVKLGAAVSVQDNKKEEDIDPQLLTFLKDKSVTCYLGCQPEDMSAFDMMILSPGVSPELDFIREARESGVDNRRTGNRIQGRAWQIRCNYGNQRENDNYDTCRGDIQGCRKKDIRCRKYRCCGYIKIPLS